ncbi:hypothetical protein [Streptomyces sp. NPDC057682]|uniref:hypothetical protein n=1 Tax=Streptomyces sp. NPDC057682 TaxID=3346210 RepID=UPI003696F85E
MRGTRRFAPPARPVGALLACGALLLAAGCGADPGPRTAARAGASKPPAPATEVGVPRSGPCGESDPEPCRVVLTARPGTGKKDLGSFRADGGREHWIYVDCRGKGSVTVAMTPEPTFDVPCGDQWPAVTESRNQFEAGVLSDEEYGLSVDAPEGVRWSLTVLAAHPDA